MAEAACHEENSRGDGPLRPFIRSLRFIEQAATDERNFVKKGVSWALRGIGKRNAALNAAAITLARQLTGSQQAAARWVGKDALRDLQSRKRQIE